METRIIEFDSKEDLSNAILIEASPTPGAVGLIAGNFLLENLKSKKLVEITSPYFPQISMIDDNGIASMPKIEMHLIKINNVKIVLMMRNFPVDSNEGSHILAKKIYDYVSSKKISSYFVLASGRIAGERTTYISSTKIDYVKGILSAGAKLSPSLDSLPVDRLTGFLMMLFARENKGVYLLFADTPSYLPDPIAAKKLLEILTKSLQIELDLSKLEEEIERQRKAMEEIEQGLAGLETEQRRPTSREPFYIG